MGSEIILLCRTKQKINRNNERSANSTFVITACTLVSLYSCNFIVYDLVNNTICWHCIVLTRCILAVVSKAEDKKRKKKKPKLDMHDQQMFIDGPDVSQFIFYTELIVLIGFCLLCWILVPVPPIHADDVTLKLL